MIFCFYSQSLASEESESDLDIVEVGSNAASPSFLQDKDTFVFMTLQNDEVEDVWKAHISKVMSESSAVLTVKTSQIFPRLYRVGTKHDQSLDVSLPSCIEIFIYIIILFFQCF